MPLGVEPVGTETFVAVDVHERFAEHCPGPVVTTSDGGTVDGESGSDDCSGGDPRFRGRVRKYGSSAHGHDHTLGVTDAQFAGE